jgi:predicted permease
MRLWKRIRQWSQRRHFEADLAEELRIHRQMAAEAGADPRAFGSVALTMEDSRAVWRFAWLDSLAQDVRYALRGLRKSPGFALTVIGTLALGLGILASSFSVFSALVLRPFAVRDPWSLYSFYWRSKNFAHIPSTWREFTDLRKQKAIFSDVAAIQTGSVAVAGSPATVEAVSGNYFTMLGARMCMGRPILESDDGPVAPAVAVVGHDLWAHRYSQDPGIVGRKLYIRGRPVEIVGVACPEFNGLEPERVSAWVSLTVSGTLANGPDLFGPEQVGMRLMPVGRLKPGVTVEKASAALLVYGRQVSREWPEGKAPDRVNMNSRATAVPLERQTVTSFLPMFAAFGLILLIACANVSNMMLARALARQREIGIRISLGAGRARVVRQLLTESLLLALPSAAAAFAVAWAAMRSVTWLMVLYSTAYGTETLGLPDLSPDFRVLVFLLAAAGVATLAFGLMPAIQATRSRLVEANRGEFANDYRPSRLRNMLVVVQVTVCALLLISAAITLRGERRVALQNTGFDPRGGFSLRVAERLRPAIAERLRADPRVALVGAFSDFPLVTDVVGNGRPTRMRYSMVSPEYFDILHIPLVRGRNFSRTEADTGASVTVVSETAARRLWPGQDAVGRTVVLPNPGTLPGSKSSPRSGVVIGVARDSFQDWDEQGQPQKAYVYFPTSAGSQYASLLVGMRGEIGIEPARRVIESAVDAAAPGAADLIQSLEQLLASRLYPFRLVFGIAGFLGGLALLMTLSGIYGVLSYLVTQRRREFGIRIALGAEGKDVARMVFRQSLKLAACGAALGALLALGVARLIAHDIQPLDAFDWRGYAGGALVVLAAALAASGVPARRAVAVDPAVTLRCD